MFFELRKTGPLKFLKAIMNFGGSVVEINDNMVTFKCITKELNKVK